MKFKTPILLSVLTRGNFCHTQCNGLVNVAAKGKPKEMCCIIFSQQLGAGENGAVRDKACLSAQRQADNISRIVNDLESKVEIITGQKDAYSRQLEQANEQIGRERAHQQA